MKCQAYTEKSIPLARGGRRHMHCKNEAVATRKYVVVSLASRSERDVALCGTHLKMFDRGYYPPRLESDSR